MNYIDLINQFWTCHKEHCFNTSEIALYFHLLDVSNSLGWKNPFKQGNQHICIIIGVSEPTLQRSRDRLVKAGLITFKSGKVKRELTEYKIVDLGKGLGKNNLYLTVTQSVTQSDTLSSTLSSTLNDTKPLDNNKLNKTKLNQTLNDESPEVDSPEEIFQDEILEPEIIILDEEEKKEKSCAKKERKKPDSLHHKFIAEYNAFILTKTDVPAKIDALQGKAAKDIIAYLKRASKDQTDEGVLASWKYILSKWDRLEPFLQNKLKLSQISSEIINILNQIKNGNGKQITNNDKNAKWAEFASQRIRNGSNG